ncbi:MAG: hypothetical protein ACK5M4_00255 [Pseudorhodobacter sp.]
MKTSGRINRCTARFKDRRLLPSQGRSVDEWVSEDCLHLHFHMVSGRQRRERAMARIAVRTGCIDRSAAILTAMMDALPPGMPGFPLFPTPERIRRE